MQNKCIGTVSSDGQLKVWNKRGAEITTIQADAQRLNDIDILVTKEKEEDDLKNILSKDWNKLMAKEEWKEKHEKKKMSRHTTRVKDVLVVTGSDDGKISIFKPIIVRYISLLFFC